VSLDRQERLARTGRKAHRVSKDRPEQREPAGQPARRARQESKDPSGQPGLLDHLDHLARQES
jgi:hypothetical protein